MRFFLVVLIIFGALLTPSIRERITPHVQPAFDPIYRWTARSQLQELERTIDRERTKGTPLPTAREFPQFLERAGVQADKRVDPWGTPYFLRGRGRTIEIGSAGPDRTAGTTDDLLRPLPPRR